MNTKTIATTLALSVALLSGASAQAENAIIGAEIVAAIAITNNNGLTFGQIVPGVAAGTVNVPSAGSRTSPTLTLASGGTPAGAASFTVDGGTGSTYVITLPTAAVTLTGPSAATMTVTGFESLPATTGTLTGGTQPLLVGATLNVGASQIAGAYSGNFDVTVAYN